MATSARVETSSSFGTVGDTGVFRVDLSSFGFATISSFTIYDDRKVSGGVGGASGLDLDFVRILNVFTNSASTAASQAPSLNLDYINGVSFSAGFVTPWRQGNAPAENTTYLWGTTGNQIYSPSLATLGDRDGLSQSARGELSLGEGGKITFSFSSPIATAGLYLYFGDVASGNDGSFVSVSTDRYPAFVDGIELIGTNSNDSIILGSGTNSHLGSGNDLIYGNEGADTIFAGAGDNTIVGGVSSIDGADFLQALDGNDLIFGNGGADTIYGGSGANTLVGGYDADVIYASDGNDVIYGNQGNDTILAGNGNNYIIGGQGNDQIVAGSGNDTIWGNKGNDAIIGGAGADRYMFAAGDGDDTIYGFNASEGDRLDVQGQNYSIFTSSTNTVTILLSGGGSIYLDGVSGDQVTPNFFGL